MFWDGEEWDVGRFIEFSEFTFDGPTPQPSAYYEDTKGVKWHMRLATYDVYRVLTIARTIDFAKLDRPTDEREQKLKQLHHRLDKLDSDDITNSTARFKLEKQIYDLERDTERDDWPEYIDG